MSIAATRRLIGIDETDCRSVDASSSESGVVAGSATAGSASASLVELLLATDLPSCRTSGTGSWTGKGALEPTDESRGSMSDRKRAAVHSR